MPVHHFLPYQWFFLAVLSITFHCVFDKFESRQELTEGCTARTPTAKQQLISKHFPKPCHAEIYIYIYLADCGTMWQLHCTSQTKPFRERCTFRRWPQCRFVTPVTTGPKTVHPKYTCPKFNPCFFSACLPLHPLAVFHHNIRIIYMKHHPPNITAQVAHLPPHRLC